MGVVILFSPCIPGLMALFFGILGGLHGFIIHDLKRLAHIQIADRIIIQSVRIVGHKIGKAAGSVLVLRIGLYSNIGSPCGNQHDIGIHQIIDELHCFFRIFGISGYLPGLRVDGAGNSGHMSPVIRVYLGHFQRGQLEFRIYGRAGSKRLLHVIGMGKAHTGSSILEQLQRIVDGTADEIGINQSFRRPVSEHLKKFLISVLGSAVMYISLIVQIKVHDGYVKGGRNRVVGIELGLSELTERQRNLNAVFLEGTEHLRIFIQSDGSFQTIFIQPVLSDYKTIKDLVVVRRRKPDGSEFNDVAFVASDLLINIRITALLTERIEVHRFRFHQLCHIIQKAVRNRTFHTAGIIALEQIREHQIRQISTGKQLLKIRTVITGRCMDEFQIQSGILLDPLYHRIFSQVCIIGSRTVLKITEDGQRHIPICNLS